jgi:hypothetical protein
MSDSADLFTALECARFNAIAVIAALGSRYWKSIKESCLERRVWLSRHAGAFRDAAPMEARGMASASVSYRLGRLTAGARTMSSAQTPEAKALAYRDALGGYAAGLRAQADRLEHIALRGQDRLALAAALDIRLTGGQVVEIACELVGRGRIERAR